MNVLSLVGVVRRAGLDLPGRAPVRAARLQSHRGDRGDPADPDAGASRSGCRWTTRCSCCPGSASSGTRTGDNTAAVATGLQRTGRIITSAALLLVVVIGAFSTSGIVFIKMIGVGMIIAILVDATVVRALLVPATMRLLGRWNWWAPAPLARFWERHGIREDAGRAVVLPEARQPARERRRGLTPRLRTVPARAGTPASLARRARVPARSRWCCFRAAASRSAAVL